MDFNTIPAAGSLRTPLFFLEMDSSQAGSQIVGASAALFVGNMITAGGGAGTATPQDLIRSNSRSQDASLFGAGSELAEAIGAFRSNNLQAEIWAVPYADAGAGVASEHTLTIAGTATADGVFSYYIGGKLVNVPVTATDTSATVATALRAAINADLDLSVTAGGTGSDIVTIAKHKAEFSDHINHQVNLLGESGGEALPAGITVTSLTKTVAGATDPDITGLGAIVGSERFDFVHHPYRSAASLNAIEAFHNHTTGRWAYHNAAYGHAGTAARDTVGNLSTLGNGRNDPHSFLLGMEPIPSQPWEVSAAAWGACYSSLSNNPGDPLQTLELVGIVPAPKALRFTQLERNVLLFDGVATLYTDAANKVRIERLVTTYQLDAFGGADDSYLDTETLFQIMYLNRAYAAMTSNKLARVRLVNDGTFLPSGSNAVTPQTVKGLIIAEYKRLEALGIVENADLFAANVTVERPLGDPNRLDVLLPPDLQNQLRVLAVKNQFHLQLT